MTRTDETYPNIVRGCGEFYRWYKCNSCAEMVDSDVDPGRWTWRDGGGVWCANCKREGRAGKVSMKRDGPLPSKAPKAYAHATLENVTPKTLGTFLRKWPHKIPFIILGGIQGSGKTYTAWAVEKECCLNRCLVRVENGLRIRNLWAGMMHERRAGLVKALCECRYLILDALTDGDATEGWTQVVQEIMDRRFENARPTLITSMHDEVAIGRNWGNAIRSRLTQYKWPILPSIDRRPQNQAKEE